MAVDANNFGNQRKDFIDRVVKYNQLDTRLDSIWDNCLCGRARPVLHTSQHRLTIAFTSSVNTSIALTTT
jgi:hypothetical protein